MTSPGPNSQPAFASPTLAEQLEAIGTRVCHASGDRVVNEGDCGAGIYLLLSGSVRLSMKAEHGGTVEPKKLEPGAVIGLSSALNCDYYCYSVEALEACVFSFVPRDRLQELLRQRTDVCLQVIQLLGQEMTSVCTDRARANKRGGMVNLSK